MIVEATNVRVAFQGVKGAYSYIASKEYFGDKAQVKACDSFQAAFDSVIHGECNFAMIPIENSTAGRVADVHLLVKSKPLFIVAEYFLPIQHCLIGLKGADITNIKTVYSHPQALMQCENNIYKNNFLRVSTSDTGGAVVKVKSLNNMENAAIASSYAANEYDMDILVNGFQDVPHNTTRFVVLSRKKDFPLYIENEQYITTLLFDVGNNPSALLDCLQVFAQKGVNLLKLESYTDASNFKTAHFILDVEAHIEQDSMHTILSELKCHTNKLDVVGCYAFAKYRKNMR